MLELGGLALGAVIGWTILAPLVAWVGKNSTLGFVIPWLVLFGGIAWGFSVSPALGAVALGTFGGFILRSSGPPGGWS